MKIDLLSAAAQEGLRRWALWQHGDEMLFDAIGGDPQEWAWLACQLRVADDFAEWFPKGKSATIWAIEGWLYAEADGLSKRRPK